MATELNPDTSAARLDKWLWAVRVFKTRPLATEACRGGDVEINGLTAKPARNIHLGEVVVVHQELMTRTLQVIAVPRSRVGAKLLVDFFKELTPASEFARLREHSLQRVLARAPGAGRPTKRERRTIDQLFG